MFIKVIPEKATGRQLINLCVSTHVKGKQVQKTVKRIGYVDEFTHLYEDPIAHFKMEAKRLTLEQEESKVSLQYSLQEHFYFNTTFDKNVSYEVEEEDLVKSYGMLPLLFIYRDLELDYFLNIKRQNSKAKYNHNHILQMLVFGRVLFPLSKLATWREKNKLLNTTTFSDDDVYRSLKFFASIKDEMLKHLNRQVSKQYPHRATLMYYDVTNYYWEIDEEDDLRRRGVCKEHRPEPIVQMGLFMDGEGLPVTYGLFPGNTNDVRTMRPMMEKLLDGMGNETIIYVGDKGIMSGTNIAQIIIDRNGYIISDSVKKSPKAMKDYILDQSDYITSADGSFKYKGRFYPRQLRVETSDDKIELISVNERQIVMWSEKYATKAHADRDKALEKALSKTTSGENTVLNNYGGNRYIKKIIFDSATDKEITNPHFSFDVDDELLRKEKELDGYYIIRTNVVGRHETTPLERFGSRESRWLVKDGLLEMREEIDDLAIIGAYRGLWKIEESFKITKSLLKTRPIFVHKDESVEAHFLSCFVALLILRLLEKRLDSKIPVATMVESLRKANLAELPNGSYQNIYCDNVMETIGKALDLDLNKKFYSKGDLKKLRGKTQKKY